MQELHNNVLNEAIIVEFIVLKDTNKTNLLSFLRDLALRLFL
jgi:hypothetical protein